MANTAEGFFEILSKDKALLDDVARQVADRADKAMFSYGSMGSYPEVTLNDDSLNVAFTAKWTCMAAFDWLDTHLEDPKYAHRAAFIQAEINGQGREVATFYKEVLKKAAGEDATTRTHIDLEGIGFWGMLEAGGAFQMAPGEERRGLGECGVSFTCTEKTTLTEEACEALFDKIDEALPWGEEVDRTVKQPLTQLGLTVNFQCQEARCTVIFNGLDEMWHTLYDDDMGATTPEESLYHGEMVEDMSSI